MFRFTIMALLAMFVMASCGDDEPGTGGVKDIKKSNVSGIIEKGPFIQGSKVVLYELTDDLSQTGKSFKSQTNSDLGAFRFDAALELNSQYVELETSGYYYNEVKGELSASQITLNALSDISDRNSVNVNLITHLEFGRVKTLVGQGMSFAQAKHKAERELLACFAITDQIASPEGISITDNNQASAILLAISTIMLYERSDAEFSEFIAKFSTDFADNGQIDNENIHEGIRKGQMNAHPHEVIERMKDFYANKGVELDIDDFAQFIDFNGDGVIDENDEEDEDEIVPNLMISEETYFSNETDAQAILYGAYEPMARFEALQLRMEAVRLGKSTERIDLANPDEPTLEEAWSTAYTAIQRANMIVDGLSHHYYGYDSDKYVAEALAIRSFLYYQLAVLWGNVPVVDENNFREATAVPQSNSNEILSRAFRWVETALYEYNMPVEASENPLYRFNRSSASILLSEIGLTNGNGVQFHETAPSALPDNVFSIIPDGNDLPIYTREQAKLLAEEEIQREGLAATWMERSNIYGTWATLKRLGKAVELTGCKEHELLLPIPSREMATNPSLKQNPGYF